MSPPLLLLVDDAPEIGLIVERLARRGGQEVISCADAALAWDYLAQTRPGVATMPRPDLMLLDINLPAMNGAAFCRLLRQTPDFAALPVALFSHWDRPEDIASGWDAGADFVVSKDLLCKPAAWNERIDELVQVVRNGRSADDLLDCLATEPPSLSAEGCGNLLTKAARQVGPAVVQAVARRAWRQAGLTVSPSGPLRTDEAPDWLLFARNHSPDTMAVFLASVVRQLNALLGKSGVGPLRQLVVAAVPSLSGLQPR